MQGNNKTSILVDASKYIKELKDKQLLLHRLTVALPLATSHGSSNGTYISIYTYTAIYINYYI
jgi:hypothetical protein